MIDYDISKYDRSNSGLGCIRRDLNALVRDESGNLSLGKVGTIVGQIIAVKLLMEHSEYIIDRADSLAILLLLLIAPEIVKKFLTMKYSNGAAPKPKQENG